MAQDKISLRATIYQAIQDEIVAALQRHDGQRPVELCAQCPSAADADDIRAAGRSLLDAKRILNRPKGKGSRYYLAAGETTTTAAREPIQPAKPSQRTTPATAEKPEQRSKAQVVVDYVNAHPATSTDEVAHAIGDRNAGSRMAQATKANPPKLYRERDGDGVQRYYPITGVSIDDTPPAPRAAAAPSDWTADGDPGEDQPCKDIPVAMADPAEPEADDAPDSCAPSDTTEIVFDHLATALWSDGRLTLEGEDRATGAAIAVTLTRESAQRHINYLDRMAPP